MQLNSSNGSRIEDFPEYNIYLLIVLGLYTPIILISSGFVISTVVTSKQLHHAHNYIIVSICTTDVCIALVVIPIHLLEKIPQTLQMMKAYPLLLHFSKRLVITIDLIYVSLLALLIFDTFRLVKYPISYWRRHSKLTVAAIVAIPSVNFFVLVLCFGIQVEELSSPHLSGSLQQTYTFIASALEATIIAVGLVLGATVTYLSLKQPHAKTVRKTILILMAYFLLSCPSLYPPLWLKDSTTSWYKKWMLIAEVVRYLSCVTNGLFILLTRPVYRSRASMFFKHGSMPLSKLVTVPKVLVDKTELAMLRQRIENQSIENSVSVTGNQLLLRRKKPRSIRQAQIFQK